MTNNDEHSPKSSNERPYPKKEKEYTSKSLSCYNDASGSKDCPSIEKMDHDLMKHINDEAVSDNTDEDIPCSEDGYLIKEDLDKEALKPGNYSKSSSPLLMKNRCIKRQKAPKTASECTDKYVPGSKDGYQAKEDLDIPVAVKPNNSLKLSGSLLMTIGIGMVGVLVFALVIFLRFTSESSSDAITDKHVPFNDLDTFQESMEKMKKDFPHQDDYLWKLLINVGKKHIRRVQEAEELKKKLSPLSFHLVGYSGANDTVDCFASNLASAFTKGKGWTIASKDFASESDRDKLNDEIIRSLNDTNKLVVIEDFNLLKFHVAQLFMSYADEHNDVASYPQSIIILISKLPFLYDSSRSRHDDEGRVGEYFKSNIWRGELPDMTNPLWTRVGDGLGLIKKEDIIPCS